MIPEINTTKYDREYCALITTFKKDSLEVDYDTFRKHVRYFTQDPDFLKINGSLIVVPEAGEIFYLTLAEQKKLIQIVMEERPKEMPIFAGAYGVRRDELIEGVLQAKSMGVDGIFVMPPTGTMEVNFNMDGARFPEIWTDHCKAIAEASQLPLILHPSCPFSPEWGWALPGESIKMIIEQVPSVVGWKMIYNNDGGHFKACRILRSHPRHVGILNSTALSGYGMQATRTLKLLDGSVGGGKNFGKENFQENKLAWMKGDTKEVERIAARFAPVSAFIHHDLSRLHIHYKIGTWLRGLIAHPFMRPPMPAPHKEELEEGWKAFNATGYSCIDHEQVEEIWGKKDKILKTIDKIHD